MRSERTKQLQKQWKQNNKYRKQIDNIKKRFNLSLEDYKAISSRLWESQKGQCAICGLQATSYNQHPKIDKTTLQLDHCHKTGKIRGLLCIKCNRGLGQFQDNKDTLLKASIYLRDSE